MDDITFFCLVAKCRQAQKAYYADKTQSPEKQAKLIKAKQYEAKLDAEIKRRCAEVYSVDEMKNAWELYCSLEDAHKEYMEISKQYTGD